VTFVVALLLVLFFVDDPWRLPVLLAGAAVELGEAALWWRWSRRRRAQVGAETLIGREAVVATPCRPLGQVRIDGEVWAARCEAGADPGDAVRIAARRGLTLDVVPL
jgi:membrane-bound serine protease (ClpP class)